MSASNNAIEVKARRRVTDPTGSESEFGRQIPVDLEADADLNEGRGVPGHWSSSLAFPCDSKVDRGGPLRKPHTTREDAQTPLTQQGNSVAAAPWDSR
jgi:hypothetical protein